MSSEIKVDYSGYSEEMMYLAVEASPNGMVMMNGKGNIVLVNSTAEKLFGYSRNELIGNSIEILIPERYRWQHSVLHTSYYSQPRSRPMDHGRDLYGLHKNGTEFPVEIGLNPIETEHDLFVLAAIVDITERKHAEEMMRLAVEASPSGMVMTDYKGTIAMINSAAEKLFGYQREQLLGHSIHILIPELFALFQIDMRNNNLRHSQALALGQGRDFYGLCQGGRKVPIEVNLNSIQTPQGIMILASIIDITERKYQEEQLKEALKEKELLLAEIHHRVKNNLQIIDSLLGMQSDRLLDSAAISVLKESQNRIKSMAVIHQILYESLDFSCVDFSSVIRNLVDNLCVSYAVDSTGIEVSIDIDKVFLSIDTSIPLGLIINELCSNAMQHAFTQNRSGHIDISFKYLDADRLQLLISDNGIGISEEFDMENAESLGLQLIHLLSEQISAELTIQRKNPTSFTLIIPSQS